MDKQLVLSNITYSVAGERSALRRDRKRAVRTFSWCAFALAMYIIISQTLSAVIQLLLIAAVGEERATDILYNDPYFAMILQIVVMYCITFPIFYLMIGNTKKAKYVKSKMSLGELTVLFLVGHGFMTLGAYITNIITSVITPPDVVPDDSLDMLISNTPLWLVILVVVIIGPIVEELIFRKLIFDRISVYGDRLAIITTALAFGLFHLNISQMVYAGLFGLVLGYAYSKTRNIKYPIILHSLANFMGTVPALLVQDDLNVILEYGTAEMLTPEEEMMLLDSTWAVLDYAIMTYGLAIAGIVLFIVLTVKRSYSVPKRCEVRLPARTIPRVTLFNIGVIIYLALTVGLIYLTSFAPPVA